MKPGGPSIHYKLGQRQNLIDIVLHLYIMILEAIVHLVQNSHDLRNPEVHPVQLIRTLQLVP